MPGDALGDDAAGLAQDRNAALHIPENQFAITDEIGGQDDKVEGNAIARLAGLIAWFDFDSYPGTCCVRRFKT